MALLDTADAAGDEVGPDALEFIHGLRWDDIPANVRHKAQRSLLDLIGVAAGGRKTVNARIIYDFVSAHSAPGDKGARLLFDGRRSSVPGAAMANAAAIDALDAHDGHRLTKGHAGVVVLPSVLAFCEELAPCSGSEFMTRFVLGYEIAIRAGIALHASVDEYHASGAWNALGAAAVGARALGLDRDETAHAMGTAEYYGPRGPMMRGIDFPTMVKDGATYGAHAGVTAALLADAGFTGAPASLLDDEADTGLWGDLGATWRMAEQYLKPWPVCRWAQPAVAAAARIRDEIAGRKIDRLVVETFYEAARLTTTHPETAELAQYSLPFPVAAMLVHGKVDAQTVTTGLLDKAVTDLAERVEIEISPSLSAAFPGRRSARLVAVLYSGEVIETPVVEAPGEPETPLSDTDLVNKFVDLTAPLTGQLKAVSIAEMAATLDEQETADRLIDAICEFPEGLS
jgi:2-methylcitrate dehydratase PrpD